MRFVRGSSVELEVVGVRLEIVGEEISVPFAMIGG